MIIARIVIGRTLKTIKNSKNMVSEKFFCCFVGV